MENYHETISATPVDELADVYTFCHAVTPSGLIKLNKVRIQADCQIKDHQPANPVAIHATRNEVYLKLPVFLRTAWKTKEVLINHQLANLTSNYESLHSYLHWLMTETPDIYRASAQIDLAYKDTADKFQFADIGAGVFNNAEATAENKGAYHRHQKYC